MLALWAKMAGNAQNTEVSLFITQDAGYGQVKKS